MEPLEDRLLLDGGLAAGLVNQLYHDLLGRPADDSGLTAWTGYLLANGNRTQMALSIEGTTEYRQRQVQDLFQSLLHRDADAAAVKTYASFLQGGHTVEQAAAELLGSPEYFQNRGRGNISTFLRVLYDDTLHRPIDAMGYAVFRQQLAAGVSRALVAGSLLTSAEYRRGLVDRLFQQFLGRGADAVGLTVWANALAQGRRDEDVVAALVASPEYFSFNQFFVGRSYQDLLGRPVDTAALAPRSRFLDAGGSRLALAAALVTSTEYRTRQIRSYYKTYLARDADALGLNTLLAALQSGRTMEQVQANLLGSQEYYDQSGGTDDAFLDSLFSDVLSRTIEPNEHDALSAALAAGTSRGSVALQILKTDEYREHLVGQVFQQFLGRDPDDATLQHYVAALHAGARDEQVIAEVVASAEYFHGTDTSFMTVTNALNPGQTLTVRAVGLDPAEPASFTFADVDGNETKVPAASVSPTRAVVTVPALVEPNSQTFAPIVVSVSLSQDAAGTFGPVDNFHIGGLVQTGVGAGTVVLTALDQVQRILSTAAQKWQTVQNASGGAVDTSDLRNQLGTLQTQLAGVRADLQGLASGSVPSLMVGDVNGQPVTLDRSGLQLVDRVLASYLVGDDRIVPTTSSGRYKVEVPPPQLPSRTCPSVLACVKDALAYATPGLVDDFLKQEEKAHRAGEAATAALGGLAAIFKPGALPLLTAANTMLYLQTIIGPGLIGMTALYLSSKYTHEPGVPVTRDDLEPALDHLIQGTESYLSGLAFETGVPGAIEFMGLTGKLPELVGQLLNLVKNLATGPLDPDNVDSTLAQASDHATEISQGLPKPVPRIMVSAGVLPWTEQEKQIHAVAAPFRVGNGGAFGSELRLGFSVQDPQGLGIQVSFNGPIPALEAGAFLPCVISINPPAGLKANTYSGSVTFFDLDNHGVAQTVSVQLKVLPAPSNNTFDGRYSGTYSGSATIAGVGGNPVLGGLGFTVHNGVIIITDPGGGSGKVTPNGAATFASTGGGGVIGDSNFTFTGTFVRSGASVHAHGSWRATFRLGTASGEWDANLD